MPPVQLQGQPINVKAAQALADAGLKSPGQARAAVQGLPPNATRAQTEDAEKQNSEMQIWWEKQMCQSMKIPDGYQDVSVLIVKWDPDLDDMHCEKEVQELHQLFKERFNFRSEVVNLNTAKKAQHQLDLAITKFVHDFDGQRNLIIVYYTGHGIWDDTKSVLHISAREDLEQGEDPFAGHQAVACWHTAERSLMEADADVFAIFDCCFASNVSLDVLENTKTYEFLAASGINRTTPSPGPKSFTRSLINALEILLEERPDGTSFTTFHLDEMIRRERATHPSFLWNRYRGDNRHIRLGPLAPSLQRRDSNEEAHDASFLTLRLALRHETLTQDQIRSLASRLPKALRKAKIKARRIDWLGFRPSFYTIYRGARRVLKAGKAFKRSIERKKRKRTSLSPAPVSSMREAAELKRSRSSIR